MSIRCVFVLLVTYLPLYYSVTDHSRIFDNGAVCVSQNMRGLKVGTRLIEEGLKCALENGSEFYLVHIVSSFAKKAFDRFEFECANEVIYADYFAFQKRLPSGLMRAKKYAFQMQKIAKNRLTHTATLTFSHRFYRESTHSILQLTTW